MSAARVALAIVLLGLSGCVLDIRVRAAFKDGRLIFTTDEEGTEHWCLDEFLLKDTNTGAIVWHIEPISWTGTPQFCSNDFPLAYGLTPSWMKVVVPAQQLQSGHTYEISGTTGNQLSGKFVFNVQYAVTNIKPQN